MVLIDAFQIKVDSYGVGKQKTKTGFSFIVQKPAYALWTIRTSSKFDHDPCSVRRGLVAAVKRCVRKTRFFRCPDRLWNRTSEARALCGFQHDKGENLSCFSVVRSQNDRFVGGLKADNYGIGKQKAKLVFAIVVLKPT